MLNKLLADEIAQKMNEITGWELKGDSINKEWQFKDFSEAMRFINKIAELAEKHDHHPELFNVYNKVSLKFYTHDAGGLTHRDFNIAAEIDKI
jgi:4a-hydroxytetrahydrobiopterin dehydratase